MGEFEKTDFAHAKGLKNVFVNYHYTMCVYFTKAFTFSLVINDMYDKIHLTRNLKISMYIS